MLKKHHELSIGFIGRSMPLSLREEDSFLVSQECIDLREVMKRIPPFNRVLAASGYKEGPRRNQGVDFVKIHSLLDQDPIRTRARMTGRWNP